MGRSIPESIKRQVREKCGYGCVVCGAPLYEYAHLIPYSENQQHSEDNIILLCSNHHSLDSKNSINITQDYAEYIDQPFNMRRDNPSAFNLFCKKREHRVGIGSNTIIFDCPELDQECEIINYLGYNPISVSIEQSELFINLTLTNIFGQPAFSIKRNELKLGKGIYDFPWIGSVLTLHSGLGHKVIIDLNNDNSISILEIEMPLYNGIIKLNGDTLITNIGDAYSMTSNCWIKSSSWAYREGPVHRFGIIAVGGNPEDPHTTPVYQRFSPGWLFNQTGIRSSIIVSNNR